ncbi:MAG TPA: RDD family protein [Caulobacteraceae bacterium]|nr:RDD family protein [Caulobacteraceae bacterium]
MTVVGRTVSTPTPGPPPAAGQVRELVTPEGVDLRLRVGSAGERAGAFLLDAVFLVTTLIVFVVLVWFAVGAAGELGLQGAREGLGSAVLIVWLLGFFLLRNGYFVIFELSGRGATPGKRIMGLRVAARDGGRLTAEAVFARNAMREIEVFLPLTFLIVSGIGQSDPVAGWVVLLGLLWTGGFALFPIFNRDRLRVGDFVAGTWVVKSPRQKLTIDLLDAQEAAQGGFAFTTEQAAAYGIKELHVLEDVLRRKEPKTMAAVADRIRGKIGWRPREGETDAAFLSAYYAALRGRLETRLLFGHRRKDKFDAA